MSVVADPMGPSTRHPAAATSGCALLFAHAVDVATKKTYVDAYSARELRLQSVLSSGIHRSTARPKLKLCITRPARSRPCTARVSGFYYPQLSPSAVSITPSLLDRASVASGHGTICIFSLPFCTPPLPQTLLMTPRFSSTRFFITKSRAGMTPRCRKSLAPRHLRTSRGGSETFRSLECPHRAP